MKLIKLRVVNLLGISGEVDLDLSRPVTLIQGQNGAGKSSLRDAVQWVLTGRCRGTDGAGRGAVALIHSGQESGAVALVFRTPDGLDHQVVRRQRGTTQDLTLSMPDGTMLSGRPAQDRLEAIIRTSPEVMEICLDPLHFLELDSRTQGSLMAGAIGLRLARPELTEHCAAYGLSGDATQALESQLGLLPGYSDGRAVVGPEQLQAVYQAVYSRRTELKKERDAAKQALASVPTGNTIDPIDLEGLRATLEGGIQTEGKKREKLGALRQQQVEWARMAGRKQELEAQSSRLEARAKEAQGQLSLGVPTVAEHERELERLKGERNALEGQHLEARRKADEATAAARTSWEAITKAKEGDASCPAHITDDPCPLLAAKVSEQKKRVPEMSKAATKLDTEASKARQAAISAEERLNQAIETFARAEADLTKARESAARSQGEGAAQWDAVQAELDKLSEYLVPENNPSAQIVREDQELHEITQRRAALEARIRELEKVNESAGERKRLTARLEEKQGQVDVAEELCKALDPKALPARILQSKIGPFESGINQVLGEMTSGQYRIAIEAGGSGGVALLIHRTGSEIPLGIALLSRSERLRVGSALAVSFALVTPFRVVAIDEVDLLTGDNRYSLFQSLSSLSECLETALLLSSAEAPQGFSDDSLGMVWVEKGEAQLLDAVVVA